MEDTVEKIRWYHWFEAFGRISPVVLLIVVICTYSWFGALS